MGVCLHQTANLGKDVFMITVWNEKGFTILTVTKVAILSSSTNTLTIKPRSYCTSMQLPVGLELAKESKDQ